jgi:O-antigen/teichoic acid export membrane protein
MLLSPIFLVRILDVTAYGQYREFMLYAMLFAGFIGFSINTNLLYFIPMSPEKERDYITSTALMMLASTLLGICLIYFFKPMFIKRLSFDFICELTVFLFFFLNLDLLDSYWLAKKRSDYVLYFSTARVFFRILAVLLAAYITRNVKSIILALIMVEVARLLFSLCYLLRTGRLSLKFDIGVVKNQVFYFAPLGVMNIMGYLNRDSGKVFISANLGVTALAIYAIGSYQLPFLTIIRASIGDTIFPEIAQRNVSDKNHGLDLWKKSNVVFCIIAFPIFVIFFYFADVFVVTLFTETYSEATMIFRVYMLWMLRQCFEMSIPIRSVNKNLQFLLSGGICVIVNLALIVLLSRWMGMIGPAVAFVVADLLQAVYLAVIVCRLYDTKLGDLLSWMSVLRIAVCALIALPVLFVGSSIPLHPLIRAIAFSLLYSVIYVAVLLRFRIPEFEFLIGKVLPRSLVQLRRP